MYKDNIIKIKKTKTKVIIMNKNFYNKKIDINIIISNIILIRKDGNKNKNS
jgi:hypothetical protein